MTCSPLIRTTTRTSTRTVTRVTFSIFLLIFSFSAIASDRPMTVRGANPFTRVFGMPMYPAISELKKGEWEGAYVLELVNHADTDSDASENLILDGESYLSNFMLSYALNDNWQIGTDVPFVQYKGGFMDNFIENWHDLFGFTNSDRTGPHDLLHIAYSKDGTSYYDIVEDNSGFGDAQVWSSYTFGRTENTRMSVRGTIKLPTGDSEYLHGSEATDFALDYAVMHRLFKGKRPLTISGYAGVLMLGDGEVLSDLQEDVVTYGGVGAVWEFNEHWDFLTQFQFQGSYFDSNLVSLSESYQLSVGVRYQWPSANSELLMGVTEDFIDDASPDFGINFEYRKTFK